MAAPTGTRSAAYRIEAMDCPTEETLIRNKLGGMAGVAALDFNLMQRVLTVHHTLDSTDIVVKAIATLGMHAQPLNGEAPADVPATAPDAPKPWWPLALAGLAALGAEAAHWFEWGTPYAPAALALAAVLVSGLGVYRKGWIAIRHGNLNINALMSIAVTGAMLIGQWPEAAMVMVLFALAVAVAVVPPLLGGAWLDWIYKALVLLVIACPCALVISTPVTIVSGLAAAARRGILIKGGVYLEQGRHLAWLALDKTGTLTHGKPVQTDAALLADDLPQARAIAASLAARSDHPVSRAVAVAAEADGIAPLAVDDFAALPGQGVRGNVAGVTYFLGNHRLIHDLGACSPALEARLEAIERQGKTLVLLASAEVDGANPRALALFAVADTVRDTSRQAIEALHALGVKTLMLSGDNPHTVQAIGAAVGIDEVRGNQLPQDKADAIAALAGQAHTHGGGVGMVGDGINDAPALARADIGFAMGAAGTDTAIETADVALMDDDLRKIPVFVQLSRRTAAILKQNIALALGIKAVFLVLTVMGMGTMWMAVFADMGASLLVVFNGLRLARGVRS